MKTVFAPLARDNLRDIQTYIAADNISAAARGASEIRRAIETLETYPLIGQTYEGAVRRLVVTRYPYVVFYEVNMAAELINVFDRSACPPAASQTNLNSKDTVEVAAHSFPPLTNPQQLS